MTEARGLPKVLAMRIKAVLSCLFAAVMLVATVLMAAPITADVHVGHQHSSAQPADARLQGDVHPHSHASDSEELGHHTDGAPAGRCAFNCCAAGMACCAALITLSLDMWFAYEHVQLNGLLSEALAGIEPSVPLRPPRVPA